MGLDQYLYADTYIGRYDHSPDEEKARATAALDAAGLTELQEANNGMYVRATVGYWRKANQVHRWFVDTVQNGNDDCGTYYVEKEQLAELHEKCVLVLAASELVPDMVANGRTYDHDTQSWRNSMEKGEVILNSKVAQAELPSAEGFFFGSTEYDQWYIWDLISTVEICEKLLHADPPKPPLIPKEGGALLMTKENMGDIMAQLPRFDLYYHSSW